MNIAGRVEWVKLALAAPRRERQKHWPQMNTDEHRLRRGNGWLADVAVDAALEEGFLGRLKTAVLRNDKLLEARLRCDG